MTTADELIGRVELAFADIAYPGDDDLSDSRYGEEPAALREDFRGRDDWRALSPEFLDQAPQGWSSALSFFSPAALHFYLPAYLIADLRGELIHGSDPAFRLCWGVTPAAAARRIARAHGGSTIGAPSRRTFDRFSPHQVQVIVDYLWWKLDQADYDPIIEQGLEHYWLARLSD
ncbi:MAG: hypothetical protein RIC56_17760 [Pseudomonadales bacterium]